MNSSIAPTTPRPSPPELICSQVLWQRLLVALRDRGWKGRRESGAFLLGRPADAPARICDFVLYDDLDPHSLDTGIIRFDGRYFGKLWSICRERRLTIVADVHVHPGGSAQSASDKAHPMVTQAGHLALILPQFARAPMRREEIGIYRYLGDQAWHTVPRAQRRAFFHIGL